MLGEDVGTAVGLKVGQGVGAPTTYVGDNEGWNDGVKERWADGTGVGLPGRYVGDGDVGATEGDNVGAGVGLSLLYVGDSVGLFCGRLRSFPDCFA
jgi:hypothetical protein